jgi:two-component system, sensor histidine kinase PdtaS
VPTLTDLVRQHTDLREPDLAWLHVLVGDWQLLADLSFADLLLWVPRRRGGGFACAAQIRPTTGPTVFQDDLVGQGLEAGTRPLVDAAYAEGRVCREGDPEWRGAVPAREETIPVRHGGRVIAVVARYTNLASARTPSRLELSYLRCAGDLAQMVAEGTFPFPESGPESSPRVGDGLVRLDASGEVVYASPNALSAYRRLGVTADLHGAHLGSLTARLAPQERPTEESLASAVSGRAPRRLEVEAHGTVIGLRVLPLLPGGRRIGSLVLARDVTELRWRERELLSKDATIREIHHRVKNNLQTVAALLRLQARRLDGDAGRGALEEAVRRVGSIALVHETLSRAEDDRVAFDEVLDRVLDMVGEVTLTGATARLRRSGSFGALAPEVATPLAMVLTELVQNALEHGLAARDGSVVVRVEAVGDDRLRVEVEDDGAGLPPGFDSARTPRLGLQIVRTLVTGELGGTLAFGPGAGGGTRVVLDVPSPRGPEAATGTGLATGEAGRPAGGGAGP